jgi:hypothetical protein
MSFERLDYSMVGKDANLTPIEEGAVRWVMKLEVVNLSKVRSSLYYLGNEMRVVDAEGFQFRLDTISSMYSYFTKQIGFYDDLLSKVKYQGALIFKMADEDTEYSGVVPWGETNS